MITPDHLAELLVEIITGKKFCSPKVININNKQLSTRGDLSFKIDIDYWRGYVDTKSSWFTNSKNILQYFMYKCLDGNTELTDNLIFEEFKKHVTEKFTIYNITQQIEIHLSNDFVLINYQRPHTIFDSIRSTIQLGSNYGKNRTSDQSFTSNNLSSRNEESTLIAEEKTKDWRKKYKLKIDTDNESEITNQRLNLLKNVTRNLLKFNNHEVTDEECNNNYVFTIKSEGQFDNYNKCLCGAVLNCHKKKEVVLTQDKYLLRKIEKIKELYEMRGIDVCIDKNNIEKDILKIANASMNYELLSIKHVTPLIMKDLDKSIKEPSFVLYNNARITAILDKYEKLALEDKFPKIISLERMESFEKILDEESWSLIYNYIMKYPDVLKAVITIEPKLEINIQLLWLFISNLCHDFSKYYRRNRILMTGFDTNQFLRQLTEKLYLLKALQIILQNSLSLLEVEEVLSM